jgi:hypothetical protein
MNCCPAAGRMEIIVRRVPFMYQEMEGKPGK